MQNHITWCKTSTRKSKSERKNSVITQSKMEVVTTGG